MPSKTEEYLALAQRTANGLTRYWESWTDYLTTASRLYKYPFADQLMIYAQRPDATACADYDIWNNRMNRYVRRGSKGIALLDESSGFPRLHYVFDVSDTGVRRNSRDPDLWQYNDDLKQPVSEMLAATYGISGERVSQQLADVAGKLVADYWDNNSEDISAIVDGSLLMDYDEAGVEMQFKSAAAISVTYTLLERCGYEGYGAQRIATYLNNAGYRARSGKCWHPGSLRGMVGNLTYMGVLRCGDARSELMPELQIIPQEEFEAAQRIREDRSAHAAEEAEHHVPLRTRGQALLSNNVYCGHCGARLALTTSRKWRKLSDGTLDDTLRIRYTCYGKLRKQTDCTGQTGYTMHILDEIIDKMVRQIFSRLRGIPKEQLITSRYAKETAERKNHLQALQAERDKAEKDLLALKTEILAVIKGESAFPKDTLAEMIAAQEKKHTELDTLCEEASAELERNAELMANVSQLYEELISYADLYDSASFEAKKMIVSQLIRRVEVYRGYQIHVDFNFDLAQYLENSDELAC